MALVAKQLDLPVYVLTDTSKIGTLIPQTGLERKDQWLKPLASLYGEVKTVNLRESIIAPDLVNMIITGEGKFSAREFIARYGEER